MLLILEPIPSPVAIQMIFEEEGNFEILGKNKVTVTELSNLLYDFVLLYEVVTISAIGGHYKFSPFLRYRNNRHLKPDHQLYLGRINHNSPLSFEVIIPLAAAMAGIPWLVIQALEKIQNWKLSKEKLRLEIEKLRRDIRQKKIESSKQEIELDNLLYQHETESIFNRIVVRIEKNKFRAIEIEINILEHNRE